LCGRRRGEDIHYSFLPRTKTLRVTPTLNELSRRKQALGLK